MMSDLPKFGNRRDPEPELKSVAGVSGVAHYNPNHDDRGEFATGPGGGSEEARYQERQAKADRHGAVVDYTNYGYQDVNMVLRHGAAGHSADYVRRTREQIQLLDDAVANAKPLTEPMTVYRFMKMPRGIMNVETGKPRVGATFRDKGFVSTSKAENVVRNAAGFEDAVVEITVPKGMRVIDVNRHFASVQSREREVILPRGSKFRVTGGYGSDDIRVRLVKP